MKSSLFLFSIMIAVFALASCKSASVKGKASQKDAAKVIPGKISDYFLEAGFQQVTFMGDNEAPSFSQDGRKLIFISRARPAHKGAQVYENDLNENRERRITFNDGNDNFPKYLTDQEIIYSSTTDEIKESVYLSKGGNKDFPPYEIYKSDLYGGDIQRLTNFPGYDAEAVVASTRVPTLYFTSMRGEILGIYKWQFIGKNMPITFVSAEAGKIKRFPATSPLADRIAWVEKDLKTDKVTIQMMSLKKKKAAPETIKSEEGAEYQDLFWHPDTGQLYYSVLSKNEKKYHLETYDFQKHCTHILFKGKESLVQPVVSSSRKPKIAFVRLLDDKKQIYMVDLPLDLGPCLEEATAAKLDK